jgi:hypothetical protein
MTRHDLLDAVRDLLRAFLRLSYVLLALGLALVLRRLREPARTPSKSTRADASRAGLSRRVGGRQTLGRTYNPETGTYEEETSW